MRKPTALSASATVALSRLRAVVAALEGASETTSFGHPTFKVNGTPFAVLDRYAGEDCLWLRVAPPDRAALLASEGWSESPYDPRRTAMICRLASIDWRRIRTSIRESYRLAALAPPTRRR